MCDKEGHEEVEQAFRERVLEREFSCLGAKSAVRKGNFHLATLGRLGSGQNAESLAKALDEYLDQCGARERMPKSFHTFIACYEREEAMGEEDFERRLWAELQALHELDAASHDWAPHVSADPDDPRFAYSFGGVAFFIVGLHPQSSRLSRRFERPALAFNFHDQFEALRREKHWERMKGAIRRRDVALQGSVNPELCDHGAASQSRQYSGRRHGKQWRAPFVAAPSVSHAPYLEEEAPRGCPFHSPSTSTGQIPARR